MLALTQVVGKLKKKGLVDQYDKIEIINTFLEKLINNWPHN
ncbi:hypothetical protein [Clostridium estertheticum]|nr:hypothetical protein [Clostridium estertheticum]